MHVWYLGIGSMMSGNALRTRGVYPRQSRWCEIPDYRRVHYPNHGMATLVAERGVKAHAVAHEITRVEMEKVEGKEPPSMKVRARLCGPMGEESIDGLVSLARFVELRGVLCDPALLPRDPDLPTLTVTQVSSGAKGYIAEVTPQGVNVVIHEPTSFDCNGMVTTNDDQIALGVPTKVLSGSPVHARTSARYRDLMVEGARAVGMDESVVAELAAVPCTPRKESHEFSCLPIDPAVVTRFFFRDAAAHAMGILHGFSWPGVSMFGRS